MNESKPIKVRQLVDWRAAGISGILSGAFALLLNIILSSFLLDSPWVFIRIIASLLFGRSIMPPPAGFSAEALLAAAGIHLLLGLLYSAIIAIVIHQWGILISFFGGAALGLAFYTINFYFFTIAFPWFYAFRSWAFLVTHILFGAFAGSVYEWLEIEQYVEIENEESVL